ncbi:MAG: ABC1 kinase family protein [Xanthobacteraceae bacterium]
MRGRATPARRAARLRAEFERAGPTFAKLAQQLAMRADVLPYIYCAELSKMLDQAPAFPTDQAIAIIERGLGRPLADMFDVFDPEPIGSASLACVFQAQLKTGERVAVKVRRPGIGLLISADLRALGWLLQFGEIMTLIPAGLTRGFVEDFRSILMEELNFRNEARVTDLFRQRATKRKKGVTAPKVHFAFCSEEVMVSEFVSGVWMWELMAAIDRNDQLFLARVRKQGIEPKALASKLIRIMQREIQEEMFFHADPHPANLIVMPNNGVCFIDFGAIGRFSTQTRNTLREFQHQMIRGDVGRMVNSALGLMGQLPPMDIDKIRIALEKVYTEGLYALNSRGSEWWEKTAAQGWLRFMEVAREFKLPATFDAILMFRIVFSYDTIIVRLNKDIDVRKEWQAYYREAAKEAKKRVQANFKRRLRGPTDMDYMAMEQLGDAMGQFAFRLQRTLENPIVHFRNMVGKLAYVVSLFLRLGFMAGILYGLTVVADVIAKRWFNYEIDWGSITDRATTFGWVQLALILVGLVVIRRIILRLNVPDTRLGADR